MKYWVLLFSVVIFFGCISNQTSNITLYEYSDDQNMIKVETEVSSEPRQLDLKEYYFAYHIFNTLLFDTNVFIGLEVTDAYEFIDTIYTYLSTENDLLVRMKNKNKKTYKFRIILSEENLIIKSSSSTEEFIIHDKQLVNTTYYMNGRKKSEMEKLDQKYNIADYFLFDEEPSNDDKIEPTLKDYISSMENSRNKFFSYLTLAQYYSLTKQVDLLEDSIQAAMSLYEADDSISREFIFFVHYVRCVDYAYNNL